jgi:hypothetical protein
LLSALLPLVAAGATPDSYSHARKVWLETKDTPEYVIYANEFHTFSDKYELGETNSCIRYGHGQLTLMMVLTRGGATRFATVDHVFTDVDELMARCYKRVYRALEIKPPPYEPFVLRIDLRGLPTPQSAGF